jgi:hypothetical protein
MHDDFFVWNVKSKKLVELVGKEEDKSNCWGAGFTRNGEYLIVGRCLSKTLYLYKIENGKFSFQNK